MQYYDVGEMVSESGATCFRMSLMWGELSLDELSCVQTFRAKSVSSEVLDQKQFACIISLIFLIFLKHNLKTSLKSFRVKKNNSTIFHSRFRLFLCFVKTGEKIMF